MKKARLYQLTARFAKVLAKTLSLFLPIASAAASLSLDDDAYKEIRKELELGESSFDALLGSGEMVGGWLAAGESVDLEHGEVRRVEGGMLREVHALLHKLDPSFGGLVRVQNRRSEFVWVHPSFVKAYYPDPPVIPT